MKNTIIRQIIGYFKSVETGTTETEIEASWQNLNARLKKKKRENYIRIFISVAAAAAIVLAVIFSYQNIAENDIPDTLAYTTADDTEEITLYLSSKQEIRIDKGEAIEFADNTVKIGDRTINHSHSMTDGALERIVVPDGKTARLTLSDGTTMQINAGSSVAFPDTFKKDEREIFLNGEIFIDVAHNPDSPFYVNTPNFKVKVLGTAFNVNAYDDIIDNQEVALVRGKVEIQSRSGKKLSLLPNQKASLSSSGNIQKSDVDAEEYTLWTQGILSLHTSSLKSLLVRLSHHYGTDISCSEDISEDVIEGKLDLDCDAWTALNRIANTGGYNLLRKPGSYELASR